MKLILSLSLALVCMLSGTARALQCLRCTNSNDLSCRFPRTVQCSDGEVCFNAFITDQDGIERIYRDCVSSAVCPAVTTGIIETNVGGIYSIANTECCDTDDCNNAGLGFPTPQAVNGRTCPGSVPSDAMFLSTVDCRGLEDTCFSGTAFLDNVEFIVGGCGSPNVCDITGELEELPFIDAGFIPSSPTCTAITTTTPEPTTTTTTPEPTTTTTTPEPTTTTTPPEPTTITTTQPTTTTEPTTVYTPSSELLGKIRALVVELKQLSAAIKLELLHQNQLVVLQLHLQLLDYQQQLLDQQEELPFDHHHQLPLYYQQSLLVHHHQLLLHQIQLSLCGQQQLLQLFYRQQLILHQLQELLHGHHHNLLPHYYSYLLQHHHKYHPTTTTEEPTTTTPTPTTTTTEEPTTTTPTPTTTTPTPTTTTTSR